MFHSDNTNFTFAMFWFGNSTRWSPYATNQPASMKGIINIIYFDLIAWWFNLYANEPKWCCYISHPAVKVESYVIMPRMVAPSEASSSPAASAASRSPLSPPLSKCSASGSTFLWNDEFQQLMLRRRVNESGNKEIMFAGGRITNASSH